MPDVIAAGNRAADLMLEAIRAGYSAEDAYDMYMAPANFAQQVLQKASPSPNPTVHVPGEYEPTTPEDTNRLDTALDRYYGLIKAGDEPKTASIKVLMPAAQDVLKSGWRRQEQAKKEYVQQEQDWREAQRMATDEARTEKGVQSQARADMYDMLGSGENPAVIRATLSNQLADDDLKYLTNLEMKQANKKTETPLDIAERLRKAGSVSDYFMDAEKGQNRMINAAQGIGASTNAVNDIIQAGYREAIKGAKLPEYPTAPAPTSQPAGPSLWERIGWVGKMNYPSGAQFPGVTQPSAATPSVVPAPRNPADRVVNQVYDTPRGPLKWTGTGWVAP